MNRLNRVAVVALSLTLLVGAASVLGGCAKSASTGGTAPSQSASQAVPAPTLELVSPVAGSAVAAGDVGLSVKTTDLKFVMPSNTTVPGEGHVHFTLDDEPFVMSTSPEYTYEGIAAGEHRLVAELVQNDTKPFSPPVKQEITFTAK